MNARGMVEELSHADGAIADTAAMPFAIAFTDARQI